jgi:hypothetical protein
LMRRSSSGSITLAPLREGSSSDLANEDTMSQVELSRFNQRSEKSSSSTFRSTCLFGSVVGGKNLRHKRIHRLLIGVGRRLCFCCVVMLPAIA